MISAVIQLLQMEEYLGVSEEIDIAKGRYELVGTWGKWMKKTKREWYSRKYKRNNG